MAIQPRIVLVPIPWDISAMKTLWRGVTIITGILLIPLIALLSLAERKKSNQQPDKDDMLKRLF